MRINYWQKFLKALLGCHRELDVVLHFIDAIICLISSALVSGNVHKLGKGSIRKSLKVAGGGSIFGGYIFANFRKI